jgi:hypothetical protein
MRTEYDHTKKMNTNRCPRRVVNSSSCVVPVIRSVVRRHLCRLGSFTMRGSSTGSDLSFECVDLGCIPTGPIRRARMILTSTRARAYQLRTPSELVNLRIQK